MISFIRERMLKILPPHRRPDHFTLMLIALSMLAAGFIFLRSHLSDGLGPSGPAISFIALARNLISGNGLVDVLVQSNGLPEPFVIQPAMYSFILVAFSFGIFDPHDVATPVNAAVLVITVMIVGQYLRRQLTSSFIAAWAAFAVALSLPLIWISSFAMSDSLFALLITLALIRCSKFIARGGGAKHRICY